LLGLIAKGEIEEDRIGPIVIITGEENLLHFGRWDVQMNSLTTLPFRNFKAKLAFFDPQPAFPSRPFDRKPSIIVSMTRLRCHRDKI